MKSKDKGHSDNIYLPRQAEIIGIEPVTADVSLFTLKTKSPVSFKPGQFFMLSVAGYGEVPISATTTEDEPLRFCIRRAGHVTDAIHSLKEGNAIGIRGPYGNGFNLDSPGCKDVIVAAGGLGIVPLRPVIRHFIKNTPDKKLFILYGARTPADIIYSEELKLWGKTSDVRLTVDRADDKWRGRTGLVTGLLDEVRADFESALSFVCGPEVMIKASMTGLSERGVHDENILTTLEAHMKCGVGKCGHCYIGKDYVCTDGPVFTLDKLKGLSLI